MKTLQLLIPVYNDWRSASALVDGISRLKFPKARLHLLLVDDGSTEAPPKGAFRRGAASPISSFKILRLARNLGHQSAIAVGLAQLQESGAAYDAVLIMDGDGEDAPADILRLLSAWEESGRDRAVFAQRSRRSEGVFFQVFYALYRATYRLLTGSSISMGNFSLLPRAYVSELLLYQELWRHYPATVKKSKLPVRLVPTDRAERLDGASKMNFYHLVIHGLGAITVHSDVVGVRVLVALFSLILASSFGVAALACARYFTATPLPAWFPTAAMVLGLVALQFLSSAIVFSFLTLAGRSPIALNPARNYQGFIKREIRLY